MAEGLGDIVIEHLVFVRAKTFQAPPHEWELVKPEQVPELIRSQDVLKVMRTNKCLAMCPEDGYWYGAIGAADMVPAGIGQLIGRKAGDGNSTSETWPDDAGASKGRFTGPNIH